jgi:hypothetical protein
VFWEDYGEPVSAFLEEDGRPFVSGAYQALYCSDRCRNRALKRAFRERHRAREVAADVERTSA